jgi:pyruvate,water dikinase
MVAADVAGVLFTANPLTTATDEMVLNASWGLGEALVQGSVTPDQYVLQSGTGAVLEQTLGAKEQRIVRDRAAGSGVVTESVPAAERERFCLDAPQVAALAQLGEQVQNFYGGLPQDIEWAIEAGALFVLQSRPITGVEFSWDAEVDLAHTQAVDPDAIWYRAFGDTLASGVVTPLTYSTRFPIFTGRNLRRFWSALGLTELSATRFFKYWKGDVYYNANAERHFVERFVPPPLRGMLLDFIPPQLRAATLAAPFDMAQFIASVVRWYATDPDSTPTGFPQAFERWRQRSDYEGLSYAQLRALDDAALIAYCERLTEIFGQWNDDIYGPGTVTNRMLMAALKWMLESWHDGGDAQATFARLVTGCAERTDTQRENAELVELTNEIRRAPRLRAALDRHAGAGFFADIATCEEGRQFLGHYEAWMQRWGHRGHADRDYIYPRRSEDRAIDVRAFKVMMNADPDHDAHAAEQQIAQRREATLAAVLADVGAKPNGAQRAAVLRGLYDLTHCYLVIRDNERARPTDALTFARKRGYVEIGRRLYERDQIEAARDFHFLSERALFHLFRSRATASALQRLMIRARARDCDRILRKELTLPMCLQRNRPVDLELASAGARPGVFHGAATSPGLIRGTARVILQHSDIAGVQRGEILVTHSTDPGWNPVFGIISGVVIETGGMLSHASCLAREYGFPAVHLPDAARLIPDGAEIIVNGDSGLITIVRSAGSGPGPSDPGPSD